MIGANERCSSQFFFLANPHCLPAKPRTDTSIVTVPEQTTATKQELIAVVIPAAAPMVPPAKRKSPASAATPESKRSKNTVRPKAKPTKSRKPRQPTGRTVSDPSALDWATVGEEEFGGIQVLSGVDIVRDGGKVQFVVKDDKDTPAPRQDKDDRNTAATDDENEPFQGFSDDAMEGEAVDPDQAGAAEAGATGAGDQEDAVAETKAKTAKGTQGKRKKNAIAEKELQEPAARGPQNAFLALADAKEADSDIDVAQWVALNLSPAMVAALANLGFSKPTAIQQQCVPQIVKGHDVIGKAQTGSGKTLAFAIPIVEKWLDQKSSKPMALILSPTRELAKQIGDHIKALCERLDTRPYVCVVTGGLSIHKQQRQLEKADIVIATPGRLWEVLDGDMSLQDQFAKVQFLVVDEADRLFKAGQFKEAENIIGALDKQDPEESGSDQGSERQTLVFSATFDKDLQTKLAGRGRSKLADEDKMAYLMKRLKFRTEPKFIDVNPVSRMAENLKEGLIECGAMEKDLYLYTVLLLNPGRRTLVFTNSISAVRRITALLTQLQQTAFSLHSGMIQKARLRALERFTATRNTILVATDVAARGLDIKDVDQVIHYNVPREADTYIHRSGRTARADRSGVSIILCAPDEVLSTRRLAGKVHAQRGHIKVMESLPVDRKVSGRLRPRVELAKKITDAVSAKEKGHSEDMQMRKMAEDLGVEYDSDDFVLGGRGGGRRRKEKEARAVTKAEMGALKAQLREELSKRVNLGVSERYIAGGRVDVGKLLRERESAVGGLFLGDDVGLGF